MIFHFNHFSLIIFYHSVWLGFELFGLRVQVCSQLVQFTLMHKGYNNHHCHNKPQTGNGDDVMPRRDELRIWKILKKIQLRSNHGVEKLRSNHGVEKLGSDHGVEDLLDHAGRQLSFYHWGRELSSLPLSWVFYCCSGG